MYQYESLAIHTCTQVGWIEQLLNCDVRFSWHIDGKHKLHHGKWMLVTIGTHVLQQAKDGQAIVQSLHASRLSLD